MASSRNVQQELSELKKDLDGLRSDYARLKNRARTTKDDGMNLYGTIKDELAATIGAIRERVSSAPGAAIDDLSVHLSDLKDAVSSYSDRTERKITAHPIAAIAGALAVGYIVARINR